MQLSASSIKKKKCLAFDTRELAGAFVIVYVFVSQLFSKVLSIYSIHIYTQMSTASVFSPRL